MHLLKILILSSIFSFNTFAASIYNYNGFLMIEGPLVQGDAAKVSDYIIGSKKGEITKGAVILKSYGGSTLESELIGTMIVYNQFSTIAKEYCISACVTIPISGKNRFYSVLKSDPEAFSSIGIHKPYFEYEKDNVVDGPEDDYTIEINKGVVRASGLNKPTVNWYFDIMMNTPSEEIYLFSKEELKKKLGFKPLKV